MKDGASLFLAMPTESYKQALETAQAEMTELLRERAAIDKQISKLAPAIEYLSKLCADPTIEPTPSASDRGLTEAIRLAFKSAVPFSLTPTEVRDKLREQGFHLDKYANELPPIHNTISRLLKSGELEEDVPRREGRAYKWVSGLERLLLQGELSPLGHMATFLSGVREQIKTDRETESTKGFALVASHETRVQTGNGGCEKEMSEHREELTSIVFVVILIVWGFEHIAVSALHAAARIRDTYRNLFPPKRSSTTIGPRIVESRDLSD